MTPFLVVFVIFMYITANCNPYLSIAKLFYFYYNIKQYFEKGVIDLKLIKPLIILPFFLTVAVSCSSESDTSKTSVTDTQLITENTQPPIVTIPPDPVTYTETVTQTSVSDSHTIDVDYIYQEPELPTGCEITSLTMLLNYLGFDIDKTELSDNYLKMDYMANVGFDDAFIGNPRWDGGYGCFAPVIKDAADSYLNAQKSTYKAEDISGTSFTDLYSYIDKDMPVVVWASMGLMEVEKRFCYYAQDGEEEYWYDNEHCMLLVGYDKTQNTVTAADPLSGLMIYNADRFEYIYDELEQQAVIIQTE